MTYKLFATTQHKALTEHEIQLLMLYRFTEVPTNGRVLKRRFLKEGTAEELSACIFYGKQLGRKFNIEVESEK